MLSQNELMARYLEDTLGHIVLGRCIYVDLCSLQVTFSTVWVISPALIKPVKDLTSRSQRRRVVRNQRLKREFVNRDNAHIGGEGAGI
jgi:hypothetical protein